MPSLFPVLDPAGAIGLAERGLMLHAVEFMLIVAIPVYILLFFFAWRYRKGNTKAKYTPNEEHGKLEELVWWVIPLEIVLVLGALTWGSTHQLDPKRALDGAAPLQVQVVALDWKWLFIYPQEGIATVNYVVVPAGRPVRFSITADAPMNSFWIPALGGQIYAMTGMHTELNLVANAPGTYNGASANYSGDGFAKMKFAAMAFAPADFEQWVGGIKEASTTLTFEDYEALAAPSTMGPAQYASVAPNLFDAVMMQFMDTVEAAGASHGAGARSH